MNTPKRKEKHICETSPQTDHKEDDPKKGMRLRALKAAFPFSIRCS